MAERGKYIALEGPDGAGKSTQLRMLKRACEICDIPHIVTREPGGTPLGAELRNILLTGHTEKMDALTEAFLFSADRRDHMQKVVLPLMNQGLHVISDRSYLTTLVFQGYGGKVPLAVLEQLTDIAIGDSRPDLMLVLMVSPEKGLERKGIQANLGLKEMRMEDKGTTYHQRNAEGYRAEAAKHPETHVLVDANGTVQEVHEAIVAEINRRFGFGLKPLEAMA